MQQKTRNGWFGRMPVALLASLLGLGAFSQAMAFHLGPHCPHNNGKRPEVKAVNGIYRKNWSDQSESPDRVVHTGRTGSRVSFDIFFDQCMDRGFVPSVGLWIGNRQVAGAQKGTWKNEKHYQHIDSSRFITDSFEVGADWPEGKITLTVSGFKDVGAGLQYGKLASIRQFREVRGKKPPLRDFVIDRSRR